LSDIYLGDLEVNYPYAGMVAVMIEIVPKELVRP
jgi:hypothetical protein